MSFAQARILVVDDDRHLLDGLRRSLRATFSVETAVGGREGLECLTANGPYAVVLSDYQMPQMNGAAFLAAVRATAPDTTRMLLTGQADLAGAAAAVNEGGVFRFLLKPIPNDALVAALQDGVTQHRLVTAERELLERTLAGSVKALMELLSLASPITFARATRLRRLTALMLETEEDGVPWAVDLAVMLSQIGAITLPTELLHDLEAGRPLPPEAAAMAARLPTLADQVLGVIPRLEDVRAAILAQDRNYGDSGGPALPLGARVLRIVRDYDTLEAAGWGPARALRTMGGRTGAYDPHLLDSLAAGLSRLDECERVSLPVAALEAGLVLADAVFTHSGVKLIPRGHELSPSLLERIRNFSAMGVAEPITVFRPVVRHRSA